MQFEHPLSLTTETRAAFIAWAFALVGDQPRGDDQARDVYVASYHGCYGLAGYVLTVNGSPPRATVIIEPASGHLVALRGGRIVRGSADALGSTSRQRYAEAIAWLGRFGLDIPAVGR